jgi:rhamnosyltransferase subunit B
MGVIWNGVIPHLEGLRKLIQRLSAHGPCVVLSHPILVPVAALARSVQPDLHIVAAYLAPSTCAAATTC